jgi:hypothetical protein
VHGLQQQFLKFMLSPLCGSFLLYGEGFRSNLCICRLDMGHFRSDSRLLGERQYQICRCEGEKMLEYVFNLLQTSFKTNLVPRMLSHSRGWRLTGLLLAGLFLTCGEASASSTASTPAPSDAAKHVAANYGKIPLSFEANKGQTDPSVQYLSRGSGYSLFLTQGEVVLNLERQKAVDTLRMKLVSANPQAAVAGVDPQAGVVSYFVGNNPKKWHTGVPTYGKVSYARVYPGVDLVFYGNQRQLEYDFVVAPGADPSRIAWQIDGAKPTVDADGNLVLTAANGPAGFKRPVVYQMDGDRKIAVDGAFDVAGERISFRLGSYDRAKPLVIDPVLTYASYLGGSGFDAIYGLALDSEGSIYVTGLTHSSDFPVQGQYESFPTKADSRWSTAFVTKFSPDGSSLVYSTYLGGSDSDQGNSIALDSSNEAYVAGTTASDDFPLANAYQTYCAPGPYNGNSNDITERNGCGYQNSAFIAKLNSTGTALVYSTFFGGQGSTAGNAIAVDAAGRAYIAGNVTGGGCNYQSVTGILIPYTCFPTTAGAILTGVGMNGSGDTNAFVAVFDPTGADLLYSTALGDTLQSVGQQDPTCQDPHTNGDGLCYIGAPTYGSGITVDGSGNFYLVGNTDAMFLPTTAGVVQPTTGPASPTGWDYDRTDGGYAYRGYIAKFNPVTAAGGASQAYTSYLGGLTQTGVSDSVNSIVTDSEGYAYVTGSAQSYDFPTTTGAYQIACQRDWGNPGAPCNSGFAAKLNPTGTTMVWSTFLGGTPGTGAQAFANSIQLDGNGNVYVAGTVQNMGSMTWLNPVEDTSTGNGDSFVAELDPTGSKLLFATPLHIASEAGLAVDAAGNMYLGMSDNCGGDIVTPGAFQQTNKNQPTNCGNFSNSGYVAKISAQGTATVALAPSASPVAAGQSVTLTATVTPTATYASVPTGTVAFDNGSTALGTGTLNSSGVATYTTSTLAPNTYSLTAIYSGDSTYPTASGTASLMVTGLTATVKVTPAASSITTASSLSVTVAVTGSGATPTGTVTLSGGGYTSAAATLASGSATIVIPANSLSAGADTLTASFSGDTTYTPATGTASETVMNPLTPTVKVTPAASSITTASSLSVSVAVSGSGATPTGTVTLSGGGYTTAAVALSSGGASITIPANSLSVGTDTLTVSYSGDTTYSPATGTASETVTNPLTPIVKVTPAVPSVTTASSLSVTVAVTGSGATPTGTVTLSGGGYTSIAVALSSGSATITIPANSLSVGTETLTVSYSGDANYASANGTASVAVTTPLTPAITVTPAATTVVSSSSLSVKVTVTGSGATPTGTVTLSGGGYTSAATTLSGGSANIVIPANSLSAGSDTLTVSYSGDSNYAAATGAKAGTAPVKVSATPLAPTVTVTPAATTLDSASTLSVSAAVTGAGVTPTGTVTLSGGGYTSTAATLSSGSYTFTIPANSLSAGTDTLTVSYSGDTNYVGGTGTASVTVTASVFTLAATTPAAVAPGSPSTSTITVTTATGYSGTVTLSCALTASPAGATDLPTCSGGSSTITLGGSTTSGTATVTVSSTAATSAMARPDANGFGRAWAGGGSVLAFLVFLGIPARRRKWLSMVGVLALMVALASLSACGGKSSSSGNSGTTAGSYTFTVTGTGSPSVTPAPTTTFTLTIN